MFRRSYCFLRTICQTFLGKSNLGLGMAGKRFTLTDDESLTLKRLLAFQIQELWNARQANNNSTIQRHALDGTHEKVSRLFTKLFPEAISKPTKE